MRLLSPFPLDHAHSLPVTGAHHPLRREFHRWMSWGNAATMLVVLTGAMTYLALKREPVMPQVDLTPPGVVDLVEPPAIVPDHVTPEFTPIASVPKVGLIDPVPDTSPEVQPGPTIDDFDKWLDGQVGPILKPGDKIVVNKEPALPEPDDFVAYEQEPTFLRMEAPVYPPMAREAGIEGTVLLRVLISKEGKPLKIIVLSGNPMLAEAARNAALTAQFSPALQQHKPVPVWVQLPVVFSLK